MLGKCSHRAPSPSTQFMLGKCSHCVPSSGTQFILGKCSHHAPGTSTQFMLGNCSCRAPSPSTQFFEASAPAVLPVPAHSSSRHSSFAGSCKSRFLRSSWVLLTLGLPLMAHSPCLTQLPERPSVLRILARYTFQSMIHRCLVRSEML